MDGFLPTKEVRKLLGVTTQTLNNWDSSGKIRTIISPSGFRMYSREDIYSIMGIVKVTPPRRKIVYCRVSSSKQLDDLQRQKEHMQSLYPDHQLVTDCGSGINWKRKGLQTILESVMRGEIEEVVVAHRDRLCRFAFDLIKFIMETNKTELIVLDNENGECGDKELADDVLSIIKIYTCRKNGRRRYQSTKDKNLSEQATTTDDKTMDGDE